MIESYLHHYSIIGLGLQAMLILSVCSNPASLIFPTLLIVLVLPCCKQYSDVIRGSLRASTPDEFDLWPCIITFDPEKISQIIGYLTPHSAVII